MHESHRGKLWMDKAKDSNTNSRSGEFRETETREVIMEQFEWAANEEYEDV